MLELKTYQIICHFCGIHLDSSTVNTTCPKNTESPQKERFTVTQSLPADFQGSYRHYFNSPIKEHPEKFSNFKSLNLQTNQLISKHNKNMNLDGSDTGKSN
jgi:hypothetical protein